jgi:hypothetical protein
MTESMTEAMTVLEDYRFKRVIDEIGAFSWSSLSSEDMVGVAWAYYFFSIQFRESLSAARRLYPADEKLCQLEAEECDTGNLSPWPGVAETGERMNHDEFMRRALRLLPLPSAKVTTFEAVGRRYLAATRALPAEVRAAAIASYEDGGLERVFRSMLDFAQWDNGLLRAFRHFLAEHVRFDSNAEQGHGSLSRHIPVDDRVLPLWQAFRDLFVASVPALSRKA